MTLSTAGCLVTSVPEYEPPADTPPYMIGATATPPTWSALEFTFAAGLQDTYAPQPFSVQVAADDRQVEARFYLVPHNKAHDDDDDPGGTLPTDSNVLSKGWAPEGNQDRGCYTLVWLAFPRENFDGQSLCPRNREDSSRLSWTVIVCDASDPCADEVVPLCNDADPEFACDIQSPVGGGS